MMILTPRISGSAAVIAFAAFAGPTLAADRDAKNAEEDRIETFAKAEKAKCNSLQGNSEDVCEAQAKANEKIAKAELDAKYDPSQRNKREVTALRAEGEFEVAKQRCQDLGAGDQVTCAKSAKARYEQAQAAIERQYGGELTGSDSVR
jgi:hypothetical protein